jgi:hypothetical protein
VSRIGRHTILAMLLIAPVVAISHFLSDGAFFRFQN